MLRSQPHQEPLPKKPEMAVTKQNGNPQWTRAFTPNNYPLWDDSETNAFRDRARSARKSHSQAGVRHIKTVACLRYASVRP